MRWYFGGLEAPLAAKVLNEFPPSLLSRKDGDRWALLTCRVVLLTATRLSLRSAPSGLRPLRS
jgi:hypothetical protein